MLTLKSYALSFVGRPYLWGGNNPMAGFDCSGFVGELLRSAGAHPNPLQRFTAQEFFNYFSQPANHQSQDPTLGGLVFFGLDPKKIVHIGFCLDKKRMIEEGGGGSQVVSLSTAEEHNAFCKIRPIPFGPSYQGCFVPDYPCVEL